MKKICVKLSAALITSVFMIESSVCAFAASKMPANMSGSFEKIYKFLFGESLDEMFEKLSADDKLRAKTAILVVLFVLVASACFITIFLLDKGKRRELDDEDDGADLDYYVCDDDED